MNIPLSGKLAEKNIRRIGYGTMRLAGEGVWGPPKNEYDSIKILRQIIESGIQHIDTADSYGPHISEELICKALYPYSDDLLIATKGGFTRQGPGKWAPCGVPAYLRQCVELSLRRLKLEAIDLYYLHRIDPNIPLSDQVGELEDLRKEGKIKSIGLSKVGVQEIIEAMKITKISAIQNKFNILSNSQSDEVIKFCEEKDIAFVPYSPLASGECLTRKISFYNNEQNISKATLALAWLLRYSTIIFPIPGTSNIIHFKENILSEEIIQKDFHLKLEY